MKNDYIVVRRKFEFQGQEQDEEWDEFSQAVRGFVNMGYELVGGIAMSEDTNHRKSVAQAMIRNYNKV